MHTKSSFGKGREKHARTSGPFSEPFLLQIHGEVGDPKKATKNKTGGNGKSLENDQTSILEIINFHISCDMVML